MSTPFETYKQEQLGAHFRDVTREKRLAQLHNAGGEFEFVWPEVDSERDLLSVAKLSIEMVQANGPVPPVLVTNSSKHHAGFFHHDVIPHANSGAKKPLVTPLSSSSNPKQKQGLGS